MNKLRMQILLEREQKRMLEDLAKRKNTSVGHLIREAVELYQKLDSESGSVFTEKDALWNLVGSVESTLTDNSEQHDHYIYGVPKTRKRKKE